MEAMPDQGLEALMRLAYDRTPSGREELFRRMTTVYAEGGKKLSASEQAMLHDIFRGLLGDVERTLRRELAKEFSHRRDVPKDLVLALANDHHDVAAPILANSPLLEDPELVEVIRHGMREHLLAITTRPQVSETVSAALVEKGNDEVLISLADNPGAAFAEPTLEKLVAKTKTIPGLQEPLLRRNEVTPELARRMYWWASAALRQYILKRYALDPNKLDVSISNTVNRFAPAGAKRQANWSGEMRKAQAFKDGQLQGAVLVRWLREGEIDDVIAALQSASKLDLRFVRRIVFDQAGESFAILCRALGIGDTHFKELYTLLREPKRQGKATSNVEIAIMLQHFNNITKSMAQRLLQGWQRDPEYVAAIERLKAGPP